MYLFPKLKEHLRRHKLTNDEDVICMAGRPRTGVFLRWNLCFEETLEDDNICYISDKNKKAQLTQREARDSLGI